jgi:four helix bundle protein
MASIKRFEDLICWQRARELANFIYKITRDWKDYDFRSQIRRAGTSPMFNIAEGFDRGTQAEFVDALFISKGECGEVRSQLYLANDLGYIDMSTLREGLRLTDECSRLIQSFSEKIKGGSRRGLQFKKVYRDEGAELEQYLSSSGLVRLPDGRVVKMENVEEKKGIPSPNFDVPNA